MKKAFSALVFAAALVVGGSAFAQDAEWPDPSQNIDFYVGYAPGGVSDTFARRVAQKLEEQTGVRVQVINRPGAGTQLAQAAMLIAPQDGYSMSLVNLPSLLNYIWTGEAAPFNQENFAPIALLGYSPNGLIVRGDSPYKTVGDLLKAAASSSSPMNAGWNGSSDDGMVIAGLEQAGGVTFNKVVYNGTPEKIQGLASGDVTFFSGAVSGVRSQLETGEFRIMAQWGPQRSSLVPDVPTASEQGYDIVYDSWIGVTYAAGVPANIREAAVKAMRAVAEDPEFVKTSENSFIEVRFVPGDKVMDIWAAQEKQVAAVAQLLAK